MMIDVLTMNEALASAIQDATGIMTLTDGQAQVFDGEFNLCLILSLTASDEVIPQNSTFENTYRLSFVYQAESMTADDLAQTRRAICASVGDYVLGLPRYAVIADAVILQTRVDPWEVSANDAGICYNLPISMIVQL